MDSACNPAWIRFEVKRDVHSLPPRLLVPILTSILYSSLLLLLILLIDTSTLVAMLAELPEGWAAAIGRVLLLWSVSASLTPASPSPSHSPGTPLLPRLRLLRRLLGLVDPGRSGGDGAAGGRRVERRVG